MENMEDILPDCYYTQVSVIMYHWSEYDCDPSIISQALDTLFDEAVFLVKLVPVIEQYIQLPEDKVQTAFLMSLIERSCLLEIIDEFGLPDVDDENFWLEGKYIHENQDEIVNHIKEYFTKNNNIENFSHNMARILEDC